MTACVATKRYFNTLWEIEFSRMFSETNRKDVMQRILNFSSRLQLLETLSTKTICFHEMNQDWLDIKAIFKRSLGREFTTEDALQVISCIIANTKPDPMLQGLSRKGMKIIRSILFTVAPLNETNLNNPKNHTAAEVSRLFNEFKKVTGRQELCKIVSPRESYYISTRVWQYSQSFIKQCEEVEAGQKMN